MSDLQHILDSTSRISFEHLNPHSGHETVLLRFEDGVADQTTCILVDAGQDVSLDDTLAEDEYLGAVLLSHAHLDHYLSLPDVHRDGAPVYTSPATAKILGTVLDSGRENHGFESAGIDQVEKHVSDLDNGWNSITESLDVAAVPAGHTPGACGFLIRFDDGFGPHHVLVTGDFTRRDAAGYPGFEVPEPIVADDVQLDALFLTQATSETAAEQFTRAVSTVLERIRDGSPTLVTASGLTGVHLAALLGDARRRYLNDIERPIIVAGHTAKLYEDLEYDIPGVEPVSVFEDPRSLFERGSAVITGPEVPSNGGAERCFESINTDSNATLVQVHTGGFDPVETAACTTYSFELNNHPPQRVLDDLVADLNPFSVVISHSKNQDTSRYHEGNYSFVWAPDYYEQHTLYQEGEWRSPDWISEAGRQRVRSHHPRTADSGETLDDGDLSSFARCDDIDLAAEGIDIDALPTIEASSNVPVVKADEVDVETATPKSEGDELEAATKSSEEDSTPTRENLATRIDELEATLESLAVNEEPTQERLRLSTRIVDAGDDITLLRVQSNQLDSLSHKTELEIEIPLDQFRVQSDRLDPNEESSE